MDEIIDTPAPAPTGFELIDCTADPRHYPIYFELDSDGIYPPPCMYCAYQAVHDEHSGCQHSRHRAWRRWRITHWAASNLYASGLAVTGGGSSYGNGCTGCLTALPRFRRGRRPYVLWLQWGTWRCLLKGHHLPGDHIALGYCAKCIPCPDCGSTTAGHEPGCPSLTATTLLDLADERRNAKPWLPEDDRDVTNGHVVLDEHGKPSCRLHGAMNRVDRHERIYRCTNERCGVGARIEERP
jgi:hypothetical protein